MTIDDIVGAVGGETAACAVGQLHIDIRTYAVGQIAALGIPRQLTGALCDVGAPCHFALAEVDEDDFARQLQFGDGLSGVRQGEAGTCANLFFANDGVEALGGEQLLVVVEARGFINSELHRHVAPPGGEDVLRLQVPERGTARHKVVEGKALERL